MTDKDLKFISFSSGSCGNCYYLGTGEKGLLIDAGVSHRRLAKYLAERGLSPDSFGAVLVTHDHLDHIHFLGTYCKKLSKPVYSTEPVIGALLRHTMTATYIPGCKRIIPAGEGTEILSGVRVRPFVLPHDATQTVGYAIDFEGYKFVIMTDVGKVTQEALELSKAASTVVIESNYDTDMLWNGDYPQELKERVSGGNGHISNEECAEALREIAHEGLEHVFLCHRSDNNNTEPLALRAAGAALLDAGMPEIHLEVLPREYPSKIFTLSKASK